LDERKIYKAKLTQKLSMTSWWEGLPKEFEIDLEDLSIESN
jgi:hypothetical protein